MLRRLYPLKRVISHRCNFSTFNSVDLKRDYMKPLFLMIVIAATVFNAYGQRSWESGRDSLLTVLSQEKNDTAKVWTMLHLGIVYLDNHPDSADYYAKALYKLSEKFHVPGGLANGLSMQAYILSSKNRPE